MLDNISNRTLLIVPNNLKNYILETINKENKLININFILTPATAAIFKISSVLHPGSITTPVLLL